MKRASTMAATVTSLTILAGMVTGAQGDELPFRQLINASDGTAGEQFGVSVGADDDVVIVGAHYDGDNGGSAGAAFIYRLDGGTWIEEQKLLASDGQPLDQFGYTVDVAGDVAVVSAAWDDDLGSNAGAVYVFRYQPTSGQWVQEAKLLASDGNAGDSLGFSVSISGNTILAGAYANSGAAQYAGAAYVFRHNGVSWVQEQKLTAADASSNEFFGAAVALSGDTAVIGKYGDATNGSTSGAAYMFRFNGASWVQEQKLLPADGDPADLFGGAVAASDDVVVITAVQDDDTAVNAGAAYVFRFNGTSWINEQKLVASNGTAWDKFGRSVAVDGDVIAIGAWWDDNEFIPDCGSGYVYRYNGSNWDESGFIRDENGWFYDYLGGAMAIAGGQVMCASHGDDNLGIDSGSIIIFDGPDDDDLPGSDCNGNGSADQDDIASGASDDCNTNGIPDECEMGGPFAVSSPSMSPIGNGSPQSFTFDDPGNALGDVVVTVTANGDFSSASEWIDVMINKVSIGSVFESGGLDCGSPYIEGQIVVPASLFNSLHPAGSVRVDLVASSGVNVAMCGGQNFVQVDVASSGDNPLDENGNGIIDTCEDDVDPDECVADISGNGTVGIEDLVAAILAWGACEGSCDADVDADGLVGVLDLIMILDHWGACPGQDV